MGEGVSLVSEFGDKGYLSCYDGMIGLNGINFQISTCLGSAPSPMCLQSIIMESKRTLEVPGRSLGGF